MHPGSSMAGQEQWMGAASSHFTAGFYLFFPQNKESLMDKGFALGNSGF